MRGRYVTAAFAVCLVAYVVAVVGFCALLAGGAR